MKCIVTCTSECRVGVRRDRSDRELILRRSEVSRRLLHQETGGHATIDELPA